MTKKSMFIRNSGYVDTQIQNNFFEIKLLIAGCGLGSFMAEALLRIGCHHITLIDHDTVAIHNLNRQNFVSNDIDQNKAESLKKRLLAINPEADITAISEPLSATNSNQLVKDADIVIDTIDFLSVFPLMALYEECYLQKKPIISSLSAGWGAIAFVIPAAKQTQNWFKAIFNIPAADLTLESYAYYFKKLLINISEYLPVEVKQNLMQVISLMADNKPCPASQVSAGSFAAAALCTTLLHRLLSQQESIEMPYAMVLDLNQIATQNSFPFKV